MNNEQFYKDKYANFKAFMEKECKRNKDIHKLLSPYMLYDFDEFLIKIIKMAVLGNKDVLDALIQKIIVEKGINSEKIDILTVDKFKRYLLLFCSIYEKNN